MVSPFYEQLLKDTTRFCQCWAVSKVRVPKLLSHAQRGSKNSMDGVDLLDQKTVTYRLGPILSLVFFWPHGYVPENIRLDEDVLKTSFVIVFRRRLQDVLIKMNIFASVILLQKMSWRRLQDVLIKTNIFVLAILLQNIFKTLLTRRLAKFSSRHLQDVFKTSSRRLQDIFKTSCKDVFKNIFMTYHQIKCLPRSRICLSGTSVEFIVSEENLRVW